MRRIIEIIHAWWIVVPLAGMLGILTCAFLSAFDVTCDTLGAVSIMMAITCVFGFAEEPVRHVGRS